MAEVSFERQCLSLVQVLIDAYLKKDRKRLHAMSDHLTEDFFFIDEGNAVTSDGWTALLDGCCLPEKSLSCHRQEPLTFTLQQLTHDSNIIYGISDALRCSCVCTLSDSGCPLIRSLHISVSWNHSMEEEAQLDSLTRLYNRVYTEEHIRTALDTCEKFCLFMIDLDNFKRINDRLGHPMGDIILKEIAEILKKGFGHHTILGRMGGDEFLAFTSGSESGILPEAVARYIISSVGTLMEKYGLNQSCSIGILCGSNRNTDFDLLYKTVDKILYRAKDSGKANFVIETLYH